MWRKLRKELAISRKMMIQIIFFRLYRNSVRRGGGMMCLVNNDSLQIVRIEFCNPFRLKQSLVCSYGAKIRCINDKF